MSKDILSSTIATLNQINCCTDPKLPAAENGTVHTESGAADQSAVSTQPNSEEAANQSSGDQNRTVVCQQPQARPVYVSAYRTTPKGPDASLHVGPNKSLLLSEYTGAKGPNPELRQGPDPSRVHGSQGALGPDRSLHCGPQLNLRQGPSSNNLIMTQV